MKLSIIIPVYNERDTVLKLIGKVEKANVLNLEKEVILIDDGSTDGTKNILKTLKNKYRIIYHQKNLGKGAALRTGFKQAQGNIILIQDADLELNPGNYPQLLRPILENKSSIVYGSRYHQSNPSIYKSHYWGVKILSLLTNLFYGSSLSDVYCGYKVFKSSALKNLKLESNGFEIEQELTVKFLKKNYQILEVPIDYYPRKFEQGKKIRVTNGLKAIWLILKYKFAS